MAADTLMESFEASSRTMKDIKVMLLELRSNVSLLSKNMEKLIKNQEKGMNSSISTSALPIDLDFGCRFQEVVHGESVLPKIDLNRDALKGDSSVEVNVQLHQIGTDLPSDFVGNDISVTMASENGEVLGLHQTGTDLPSVEDVLFIPGIMLQSDHVSDVNEDKLSDLVELPNLNSLLVYEVSANQEMQARRAQILCYNCDKTYSFDHICQEKQIYMLIGENPEEEVELFDNINQSELIEMEEPGDSKKEVSISLNALQGITSYERQMLFSGVIVLQLLISHTLFTKFCLEFILHVTSKLWGIVFDRGKLFIGKACSMFEGLIEKDLGTMAVNLVGISFSGATGYYVVVVLQLLQSYVWDDKVAQVFMDPVYELQSDMAFAYDATYAVGVYMLLLFNLGGFLTTIGCMGSIIWCLSTSPYEEKKRLSLLMASALFEGASIGPLIV